MSSGKLVELKENREHSFSIFHNGGRVGELSLSISSNKAELSVFIEEKERNKGYAASAVYDFLKDAHEKYDLNTIYAEYDGTYENWKHVLEHNGFEIVSRENGNVYYAHRRVTTAKDDDLKLDGREILYFAGGCFWGMEKVFKILDGVIETKTGYANGHTKNPNYADVCRNDTGYKETVRVIFDPACLSVEKLLKAYFLCIDPRQKNGQGGDIGTQYMTGVYYRNPALKEKLESVFAKEKAKYEEFYTELKPLEVFYEAEEYHQDYLTRNKNGYCHITAVDLEKVRALNAEEK